MRIGFDAKRAFFNTSGLGNYSRDTISLLCQYYPFNDYVLYTPDVENSKPFTDFERIRLRGPEGWFEKQNTWYWRSRSVTKQIIADKIDLYHGLSNELPASIEKTKIPSICTIHDVIFFRYPQYYKYFDRKIYEAKFSAAVKNATKVIAVSNQTKEDLIHFLKADEKKVEVVYQGCNPAFYNTISPEGKEDVAGKYGLPSNFVLYVGTIEDRKNLLSIVKAFDIGKINEPLVIVGRATPYIKSVVNYILAKKIKNVFFYHNIPNEDLPAIYQMAKVFVYPSLFEGFGIPILEALNSRVPVITSKGSCFSEPGGKSSIYVNPEWPAEIADGIKSVLNDSALRSRMKQEGFTHAQQFRQDHIARNLMNLYEKLI